jgi:hypothetical protein
VPADVVGVVLDEVALENHLLDFGGRYESLGAAICFTACGR